MYEKKKQTRTRRSPLLLTIGDMSKITIRLDRLAAMTRDDEVDRLAEDARFFYETVKALYSKRLHQRLLRDA